jgi:hypothetical protein
MSVSMTPSFRFIALVVVLACPLRSAPPARHLFLDPAFLQKSEKAALHVNPPERREVVMRPDRPWEQLMISFYTTVIEEDGKLRLWYICRDPKDRTHVAYAESTDGVNWIKPNLGVVSYEGSKDTNLVELVSMEGTVFRDPKAAPEQRYSYITHLWTEGMVRFYSADGYRWSRDTAPLVKLGADNQAVAFWDEPAGKYALYLRGWEQRADQKRYRKVVRADLPNLTEPLPVASSEKSWFPWGKDKMAVIDREFPQVLATDDADPPDSDVYTISAQTYPLDPRWYLGFPSFFQREKNQGDGRLDVECIGSRDGFHWNRYDRTPYARPGLAGSENGGMVFIGPGMIVRGDEIWQYGTGFHLGHGEVGAFRMKKDRGGEVDGVIYRYVQRVDGFVSIDFDAAGGTALTAPVKVDGPRLALNLDTAVLGHLRVGLLDADGKAIAGFGVDDCQIIRKNATRAVVTWKGGADLATLQGRDVQLTFTGAHAKLYSFYFVPDAP